MSSFRAVNVYVRNKPIFLSNTVRDRNSMSYHGKVALLLPLLLLAAARPASPQLGSIFTAPALSGATVDRPDFGVRIPRPNAPAKGEYDMTSDSQDGEGGVTRLHGHVVVELYNATFKADDAEYDEDAHTFTARGNIYYRNYERNEVLYADSVEYNTETEHGTFHHVRGYTKTKVVARPGVLLTQEPFYFEGVSAEKFEDLSLIHI